MFLINFSFPYPLSHILLKPCVKILSYKPRFLRKIYIQKFKYILTCMFVIAFEYLNKDKSMTRSSIRGKNNIWTDVGFIFVKCLNEKDQVLVGISQLSMISFTTWDIHKINIHVVKVMHYNLVEAISSISHIDRLLPSL